MKKIIVLITLLIISSCSLEKDCADYVPPPPTFAFQFIDKATGDDLLLTKKFLISNIKVVDEDDKKVNFNVSSQADSVILILSSIGWNLNEKEYTITLNEKINVKIGLDMKSVEHECYTTFEVESFKVKNYEYQQEGQTGIIQIKI